MGGKALKNIETTRLDKVDYLRYKENIFEILNSVSNNFHFIEVPSLKEKEDFGDMDILYYSDNGEGFNKETLYQLFNKNDNGQVVKNGNVISVSYLIKENTYFQLDFIYVDKKDLNFNLFYLGYNDVGNLLGRLAFSLGLKLKNNGLFYRFADPENPSKFYADILITKDVKEALFALGYNEEDYLSVKNGFYNREDIYSLIIKSDYFNVDYYLSENQNSKHRKRDKKRDTYSEFLSYLDSNKDKIKSRIIDKTLVFNKLKKDFPLLDKSYEEKIKELKEQSIFKEKFNGEIVKSITGLDGENLGKFIKQYKLKYDNEAKFRSFIINNSGEEVEKSIVLFLSSY